MNYSALYTIIKNKSGKFFKLTFELITYPAVGIAAVILLSDGGSVWQEI